MFTPETGSEGYGGLGKSKLTVYPYSMVHSTPNKIMGVQAIFDVDQTPPNFKTKDFILGRESITFLLALIFIFIIALAASNKISM